MNYLRITVILALVAFFTYGMKSWSVEQPNVHRTASIEQIEQM